MLGRVAIQIGKAVGTVATGIAIDRATNPSGTQSTPSPGPTGGQAPGKHQWPLTGDQRLANAAREIAPDPGADVFRDGIDAQFNKRGELFNKLQAFIENPGAMADRIGQEINQVKDDVNTIRGAFAIGSGGASLTRSEVGTIASAAAIDAGNGIYGAAKAIANGAYVAATTTPGGIEKISDAVTQRVDHDIKQAVTGAAVSSAVAGAIGAIPHPLAKVASVAINVSGKLATGAQLSESLREAGGSSDDASATQQAVGEILRSKAGGGSEPGGIAPVNIAQQGSGNVNGAGNSLPGMQQDRASNGKQYGILPENDLSVRAAMRAWFEECTRDKTRPRPPNVFDLMDSVSSFGKNSIGGPAQHHAKERRQRMQRAAYDLKVQADNRHLLVERRRAAQEQQKQLHVAAQSKTPSTSTRDSLITPEVQAVLNANVRRARELALSQAKALAALDNDMADLPDVHMELLEEVHDEFLLMLLETASHPPQLEPGQAQAQAEYVDNSGIPRVTTVN
ncbi:hypothetical protein BLA18110_07964 [Burkholderia lata]|uniref:hypothetical protein n=1 Tax=Burkholderia lata (strain ATCC 17760 / DSM 23089 / LMG 22485 / NCIMB 9086 / R18194 / 383) TaxID=482957 RepID=UPI0014549500|nr:hypothetical protein [Burkholderia lata]VWD54672.1 hypothetical protein BLA18110_07964 [Burkholderia lata]